MPNSMWVIKMCIFQIQKLIFNLCSERQFSKKSQGPVILTSKCVMHSPLKGINKKVMITILPKGLVFYMSHNYKNQSDSGLHNLLFRLCHRLHISTSSCLLSRCVFRPALGWSADQHFSACHTIIYLITTI